MRAPPKPVAGCQVSATSLAEVAVAVRPAGVVGAAWSARITTALDIADAWPCVSIAATVMEYVRSGGSAIVSVVVFASRNGLPSRYTR